MPVRKSDWKLGYGRQRATVKIREPILEANKNVKGL